LTNKTKIVIIWSAWRWLETSILIVHGYSDQTGHQRLAKLLCAIRQEIPEIERMGLMPEYLKRYGPRYLVGVILGRKRLGDYAQEVLEAAKDYEVMNGPITIIIGYSMGGLIARYVAKRLSNVEKLLLIGTPNLGIETDRIARWKKLFLWRIKCVKDTFPDSKFLRQLNSELPLNCQVFLIVGSKDKFVSLESGLGIIGVPENQKIVLPLGHSELIPKTDGTESGAIPQIIQLLKTL